MHKFCATSRLNKEYIHKGYNPILAMLFDEFNEWKVENGKWKVISNGAKNASLRSSLPGWGGLGWGEIVGRALRYFAQLKVENGKWKVISNDAKHPTLAYSRPGRGEIERGEDLKKNSVFHPIPAFPIRGRNKQPVWEQSPNVQLKIENGKWTINIPCPGRGRVREGVISC